MTREEMIIEYYENGKIPFLIKLYDYIKENKENEYRNNSRMDKNRNNTILNDGNNSTWISTMHKKISNERVENEK